LFFVSLGRRKDLVAAHVAVLTAVLVCVAAAVSTNSGGDDNLDDGNLVHDTILGVGGGGHNLVVLESIGNVGKRGDGGEGRRIVGRHGRGGGLGGDHGGRALDVEDRDTATTQGVSRSVGLSRNRSSRGESGLDGLLVLFASGLDGRGVLGSVLNRNVTTEAVGRTSTVVNVENLGHILDLAHGLLGLALEAAGEDGAVLDATREVGASLDSGLKSVGVPSVDEISVVSVACLVLVVDGRERV
jgi:hypothetical protein